jgi:methyl-accepting chemotaxis protein
MADDPVLAAIGRIEAKIDTSVARLETKIDTSVGRLGASVASLAAALEASRREARAELAELRVAMMSRMDRMQDTVTEIRDDIGVAMGAADAMQRANDNTRELVRLQGEQLTIMFRQIKRLEEKVRGITGDP